MGVLLLAIESEDLTKPLPGPFVVGEAATLSRQ